jgi:hypothetical protein
MRRTEMSANWRGCEGLAARCGAKKGSDGYGAAQRLGAVARMTFLT